MNRILLLSDADVHALKKSELQEFLKLFDAKTTDNKPELQERLKAYIRRANQSGSSRSLTDDDLTVVSQELDAKRLCFIDWAQMFVTGFKKCIFIV